MSKFDEQLEEELKKKKKKKQVTVSPASSNVGSLLQGSYSYLPTYERYQSGDMAPIFTTTKMEDDEDDIAPIGNIAPITGSYISTVNDSKLDELFSVSGNSDFKTKSGYISTKSDGFWDKLSSKYGMGYTDLQYEYINNQNNIRDEISQRAMSWGSDNGKTTSSYEEKALDYMTDDEVSVYNYYYQTEGKDKAEEFLDAIAESLNARKAGKDFTSLEGKTAKEILYGVEAGTNQFKQGVKNLGKMITGSEDYIPKTATQILSGMVREDLADDGFKILGNSLGQIAFDATTTASNMAPTILVSMVSPHTGLALMGSSAAGNAYQQALQEGHDKKRARVYATGIGVLEAGLQSVLGGIGKLGGTSATISRAVSGIEKGMLRFALEYGGKIGSEALEEVLQEVLDPLVKNAVFGTDEEVNWEDVAYSSLLGGIMGAGFGASEVSNTRLSNSEAAVVNKEFNNRVAEKEQNGKKLSNTQKNKIYDEVLRDMDKGYISTDLIEEVVGGDTFKAYKDSVDREDALIREHEELGNKQNPTLADQYRYGELDSRVKSIKDNNLRSKRKDQLEQFVRDQVKGTRLEESYMEIERGKQDFVADYSKYEGMKHPEAARKTIENLLKVEVDGKKVNNTNRVHDFVDLVAKASADTGLIFSFQSGEQLKAEFIEMKKKEIAELEAIAEPTAEQTEKLNSLKDILQKVESGKVKVNGSISNGSIVLNLDSPKVLNRTVGHEITHSLEKAKSYEDLKKSLFAYAKTKGIDIDSEINTRKLMYEGVANADPEAELVSDLVGDFLFNDIEYINKLSVENRNVFQRIYDEIKHLLKLATAGSKEARQLEQVKRNMEKAYREAENSRQSEEISDSKTKYSIRKEAPPKNTGVAYKVFFVKDGKLYPPMVANPGGADTPMGVWLNADMGTAAPPSKTGRAQVKAGGKGTQGGGGSLAFRPGWHLGDLPRASQFDRVNPETGKKELFPENFVWAEVEYAKDVDYQEEAMSYGYTDKGKFRHAYAGLPRLPENGYYRYRTNPKPDTVPWVITGAMKVNRLLSDAEVNAILEKNGVPPVHRQGGDVGLDKFGFNDDGTVKYSLSADSDGRQLSQEQQEFFKDSAIRDKDGNLMVLYHGTQNAFTVFDIGRSGENYDGWSEYGEGIYLTPEKKTAEYYGDNAGRGREVKLMEVYADIKKPFSTNDPVDFDISDLTQKYELTEFDERFMKKYGSRLIEFLSHHNESVRDYLTSKGFDGVWETIDGDVYQVVAYAENQVKNVDNRKPTSDPDIRYSLSQDSDGNKLTEEQAEYFKNSKMRDENGNLKPMYHGSNDGGFHVFDRRYSDDHTSFFFVDSNEVASSYSGTSETYAAKTIRTAEDMNRFLAEIGYDQYEAVEKDGRFELLEDGEHVAASDTAQGIYEEFCWYEGVGDGNVNYKVYLNLTNPLEVDADGREWNEIQIPEEHLAKFNERVFGKTDANGFSGTATTRNFAEYAMAQGYDGVIFRNILDVGGYGGKYDPHTVAIAFDSNQIKSVANEKPTGDADIRYSLSDNEYLDAVNRGDMAAAQQMVNAAAKAAGYTDDSSWKMMHSAPNAKDDVSLVALKESGLVPSDYWDHPEWYTYGPEERASFYKVRDTIARQERYAANGQSRNAMMWVYRAVDKTKNTRESSFRNGDWVTPSREYAVNEGQMNPNGYRIIKDLVPIKDLYWDGNSIAELGYDDGNSYAYADTKNYRKLLDPVTYDDEGKIIPLSKRFKKRNEDVRYSLSKDNEGRQLSPATAKRFSNSKAVDENGKLLVLYHGTASGEFNIFDKSKGNVEGDFGSGFYFTNDDYDVEENYEDGGPDFENKVARLAEQIEQEEEIDYDEAEERARSELYKGGHRFEVYLNIENPAVVGETILFDEEFGDRYNEEDFDDYDEYIAETEQAVADSIENIVWEVDRNVDVYSTDGLADVLFEAFYEGGIGIEELKKKINELYLEDSNGNLVGNEVTRQIIESLGYDGIIDPTVSQKFNMGLEDSTTHYIVFKPNQIKAVTNQNPTDNPDIHRSLSGASEGFTPVGRNEIYVRDLLKTAPAQEEIAPAAESATAEATTAPVEATTEAATADESSVVEDLFPDDLAPAQLELENLMAEQDELRQALEAAVSVGDYAQVSGLTADYESVTSRIREIQAQEDQQFQSLGDADMPPEPEAPYPGEPNEPADPFAERDMVEVGKRSVKAYQYENPEVKPFFQDAAYGMLGDLHSGTKGEKIFNDDVYYRSGGEEGWMGTKRHTTADIAELLDTWHYTYAEIEEGLNDIIEDNGKENNAVSKRIEFMLDDRLRNGYTGVWGEPIPANQEYINLLKEKQVTEYSEEAFKQFMANADQYAPTMEEYYAPMLNRVPGKPQNVPVYSNANGQQSFIPNGATYDAVPSADDIAPMYDTTARNGVPEGQQAFLPDAGVPKRITRKELHANIISNIKARFAENGFDFDAVLKKAKNLSTFSTVDNIPQRVMEKALGYKEGGILADFTVNKVAQHETDGIKWLKSFTDRKNGLLAQISRRYNIKPGSKESAAAQMYAEGFYVGKNNDIIQYGDRELTLDFPDPVKQAQIKGLARDPRIRQIYDDTLKAINESRTRNAYPEIPRLDNYFLHFRAMNDTFSRLGLPFNPNDIRAKDLPTDLNGVTADLKPGQPFFASAMHREGKRTSFDLLGGLEQYLTSAKNQIYHIDDIQNLRALRNYIADAYGQAHGLENLDELSQEAQFEQIKKVYDSHLSTFAKFLHEEANVLAGKTALIDRGLEGIIGRRGMTFLDTVNRQVGANMVGYNVSSSLTNFLAPVQAFAKSNKAAFLKGFAQTVSNRINSLNGNGDGFAENSPVMIRRRGAERFHRTFWQKMSDPGYVLMSAVDDVSTELIARSKYNELTAKGMDSQQAHIETDKWVSRLMGDRSLGQQPQLYNSKMLGIFTKFQLEVRNQLDSQFYDTIQEAKVSNEAIQNGLARNAKTAAKVASTFVQLAIGQHLFGKVFESVAGYNPAFDIISAIIKTFGWDDDEDDEDTVLDNIEQGFFELMEDMPYYSIFSGGRIPIESALPVEEFIKGKDQYGNDKSRWETLGEAAPYYFLPGGYGQIKKTVAGLGMFSEDHPIAGSYTDSGNLRFPVEENLLNRAQAAVFGQYASGNARDYFDNERSALKLNQIQEFMDVGLSIQDYWKYRDGLKGLSKLEDKIEYINGLDLTTAQKNILANNLTDRKEPIDLSDYDEYSTLEEFDWANKYPEKYAFLEEIGISYDTYKNADDDTKDAYNWAFENPDKYPMSKAVAGDVVEYRRYASELYDIRADKDSSGKSISGSRKEKVLAYINSLDIDYGAKLILFKSEYKSDDESNEQIIDYLNSRDDISYEEMIAILKELDFTIGADGTTIYWD